MPNVTVNGQRVGSAGQRIRDTYHAEADVRTCMLVDEEVYVRTDIRTEDSSSRTILHCPRINPSLSEEQRTRLSVWSCLVPTRKIA